MGLYSRIKKRIQNKSPTETRFQLVSEYGSGFYAWDGNIYKSDIVRAAIRPKVRAIGKLGAKHIRETQRADGSKKIDVNPEPYIRFLLEEPNPLMSGQKLLEKLATQLALNNNAFALIIRDANGFPAEIYPIPAVSAQAVYDDHKNLWLKFWVRNGKTFTFPYSDIIHLRDDYNEHDIFGTPKTETLAPLMEIVTTIDQGIVKAVKNSNVIRWLLKFTASMRPEDLKNQAKEFAKSFNDVSGDDLGVAAVDSKAEAKQIEPKDFVPNAAQMDRTTRRIYSTLNTNEKIVQSNYTEDEWNSFFEAEIEPAAMDLQNEYTRKIFSRRERGCGNKIVFEAINLQCASISTKLNLVQMVDRGALVPNEWRAVFNLAPVPGGDEPIRRLDTRPTTEKEGGGTDGKN